MKTVSIIVPIYNTAEFLHDCLTSVINQTYPHLEILLMNDGSTDQSYEVISEFEKRDNRIKSVHFNERKGVGFARNQGLERATGEYVYFLDSDDYLAPNTIELLVEYIQEYNIISGKIKKVKKQEDSIVEEEEKITLRRNISVKRQFRRMSVLHKLFTSDFIRTNRLRFSEDVDCYSDLAFIVPTIMNVRKIPYLKNSFYFKRQRNDPISNPALMQLGREKKAPDFLRIYNFLRDEYGEYNQAALYLDRLFLNFYRRVIIMLFAENDNVPLFFEQVADSAARVNPKRIKRLNFVVKRELKLLIKRKLQPYNRLIKLHHLARNIKRAVGNKRKMYIQLYRLWFMRLPLKEKTIVLESFLGKNYSDSPKYIYEYMLENQMDYQYVWIFNKTNKKLPGNAKQVKRFSLKYYYYMATAKYWVSNSRLPLHLNKREGNIYLQTWHGTPLKKLVFDMNDIYSANPNYKRHFYLQSRRWDYLISPNQYSSDIFRRAFKFEKEMLEFGYPRNDILYVNNNESYINTLKQSLNIPVDKKVILYAPTWRDDEFYEPGKYKFQLQLDLQKMKERLGDEYVVALRMHYFIADEMDTTGFEGFAYNFSKYDDIAELYLISDILITDYSSVFFDYANLKRPILFYTYDLEKYRDTLRGFYIDVEQEVPGPLLKTTEDIIDAIENIETLNKEYQPKYEAFYNKFCDWDNGEAAEKVVKRVFESQ